MRLLSILEPSILHIDRDGWRQSDVARAFEHRWLDLMDSLSDAREAGCEHEALTNLALESLIWDPEHAPAWAVERDGRQRLLPLFYQRLMPMMRSVVVERPGPAETQPSMDDRSTQDPWLAATSELLGWAADQPDDLMVQLGIRGATETVATVIRDGVVVRTTPMCHDYHEFLAELPLDDLVRLADEYTLPKLAELQIRRFESGNPDRKAQYHLVYTDTFLGCFADAPTDMKPRIVGSIVGRVTQNQKSAQSDKGLGDEPLKGKDAWRRCRVTRDWRIHYSYAGPSTIQLETVGPHDFGL